jgi:phosphatidylinositol-3-phosphatase
MDSYSPLPEMALRIWPKVGAILVLLIAVTCGKSTSPTTPTTSSPSTPAPGSPTSRPEPINHIVVVVEENAGFGAVIGNPAMPYLNSLASQYGLATEYYANTHPSIGNYFMLTVGNTVTNDNGFSGVVADDNIVRELLAAGKTWKSYAEDLPSPGYTGGDTGGYARKHNVFALLADVVNNPAQVPNLAPFTQFAADVAAGTLPNYSVIAPNLCNDAHDCSLTVADGWLRINIGPLLNSAQFLRDGLLIVTFDEAADDDVARGGGRVAWIAASPRSKRGYRSSVVYQHESTLRLTAELLGVSVLPNRAAGAADMREFFSF